MKKHTLSALAAAALVGAFALPAFAQNLAIVNGKAVPKARADALAQQIAKSGRPVTPEIQAQLKDEVIAREIFMQEAQKRGLDATDDFKAQLDLARQTILIRELFADYQKTNPVTDADIKAEYVRQRRMGGASDDPHAGPCMHIAPIDRVNLGPQSTYRYRYWLVVGDAKTQLPRLRELGFGDPVWLNK